MFFGLFVAVAVHGLLLWYLWERVAPSQERTRKKTNIYGLISLGLFVVPFFLGRALESVDIIAIAAGMGVLPAGVLCYFLFVLMYDAVSNRILRFRNKGPKP
jgi:hypothetical protein